VKKNTVEPDRPQMTIWRVRVTWWIPKATNTHTPGICNTYFSSTTTMVTRTHTLYVHTSPALTCNTLPCLDLLLRSLGPDHLVSYRDFEHPRLSSSPPSTRVFSLLCQFTSHDRHHAFRIHVTQKAASVLRPT